MSFRGVVLNAKQPATLTSHTITLKTRNKILYKQEKAIRSVLDVQYLHEVVWGSLSHGPLLQRSALHGQVCLSAKHRV